MLKKPKLQKIIFLYVSLSIYFNVFKQCVSLNMTVGRRVKDHRSSLKQFAAFIRQPSLARMIVETIEIKFL